MSKQNVYYKPSCKSSNRIDVPLSTQSRRFTAFSIGLLSLWVLTLGACSNVKSDVANEASKGPSAANATAFSGYPNETSLDSLEEWEVLQ